MNAAAGVHILMHLQDERDQALATIARVQAILDDGEPALIVARVRAALKSNPTKGE